MKLLNYIKRLFKKSASSTSASADTPDQKHIVSKPSVPRQVTPKPKVPVKKIPSKQPVVEAPVQKKVLPELQSKAKVGITKKKPLAITIGLDFGTSTTKCIVNLEGYEDGKDKFLAVAFPHKNYTEGVLCVPTAIGISGDSLVFGYDADILPEENVIRSFKMAIPCMKNDWGSYKSPYMIHDKPGYFKISGQGINAAGLSILYLSWIINLNFNLKRNALLF